jgi:hypothetical protein
MNFWLARNAKSSQDRFVRHSDTRAREVLNENDLLASIEGS